MPTLGIDTEFALREVEKKLEDIGCSICDAQGGHESWNAINRSLEYVRDAIRSAWKIG